MMMAKVTAQAIVAIQQWIYIQWLGVKMRLFLRQYSKGWDWADKKIVGGEDPKFLLQNIIFRLVCNPKPAEFVRGAKSACNYHISTTII